MSVMNIVKKVSDVVWEIPDNYKEGMHVPGRIYVSEKLLKEVEVGAVEQCANVSMLPGIVKYSLAMPDIHYGYGFPIGGVAAFNTENGIISPGGVGFDINCGVRVLKTGLNYDEIKEKVKEIVDTLFREVPSGVGSKGKIRLSPEKLDEVLDNGAKWAVENGYGYAEDLEKIEENGRMEMADSKLVSETAKKRGAPQLGTLGSGNHFLEVQYVDKIFDERVASKFGIERNDVTVMIHTGSRGCGHQILSLIHI